MNKLAFCVLCKSSATLMCQRCRELYCSIDCQLIDWPQHKRICIPMPSLIPLVSQQQFIDINTPPATPKPKINHNRSGIVAVPITDEAIVVDQSPMKVIGTPSSTSSSNKNMINNNNNLKTTKNDIVILSERIIPPRVIKQDVAPIINIAKPDPVQETISVSSFSNPRESTKNYPSLRQQISANFSGKDELKNKTNVISPKFNGSSQMVSNNIVIPPVVNSVSSRPFSTPLPPSSAAPTINNQSDKRSVKSISNWDKPFLPSNNDSFTNVLVQYVEPNKSAILWVTLTKLERDCEKLIKEINKNVSQSSPRCCASDIELNRVFAVPFEGIYYRAIILELLNPLNEVFVRLIDYGNEFYVKLNDIRQPIPLMKNLNAFAFPIQLINVSSNEKKSSKRQTNYDIGDQLDVKILNELKNGVYLVETPPSAIPDNFNLEDITTTNDRESKQLTNYSVSATKTAPAIIRTVAVTPPAPAPITIINQKQQNPQKQHRFRLNDLTFVNIPTNKKMKLFILDTSQIIDGFITACIFDTEKIQKSDDMSVKINIYCEKTIEKSYTPEIGEICLAKYNEDGQWYRAMCAKIHNSDLFSLSFVDYGNLTEVNSNEIRQITSEFMYPCLANDCSIAGVPEKIKPEKVTEFFQSNPVFDIEYAEMIEENSYIIYMHI